MGQRIEVAATPMGEVALFSTDRSITGQDGLEFDSRPELDDPPSTLGRRLFDQIEGVDHVYILSNMATVRRSTVWDENTLEEAAEVIAELFVHYPPVSLEEHDEGLRERFYNATITDIRAHNLDLWVIKVTPDEPLDPFKAGQYTTLALGYWESRADDAMEDFKEGQRDKLARRSYSVSSPILTDDGDLVGIHPDEIEFYVVKVNPTEDNIPGLTPRLFMNKVGDRIFMGRKFAGRYTLDDVEPSDTVVFLSTGTGEAPQNAMTAELLRSDHKGQIISVVCVRYNRDLAYADTHPILLSGHPNYHYVALSTREPETVNNKVYIQDYVKSGALEAEIGMDLGPSDTHVFICGNPAMIGIPEWTADGPVFPETLGVCQLLHERGFSIDHGRARGNVHYEEYW